MPYVSPRLACTAPALLNITTGSFVDNTQSNGIKVCVNHTMLSLTGLDILPMFLIDRSRGRNLQEGQRQRYGKSYGKSATRVIRLTRAGKPADD